MNTNEPLLLIDGIKGVYVPMAFAQRYPAEPWGIDPGDITTLLEGPDSPDYWDAWSQVLRRASFITKGGDRYHLDHCGDLFAVPTDTDTLENTMNNYYAVAFSNGIRDGVEGTIYDIFDRRDEGFEMRAADRGCMTGYDHSGGECFKHWTTTADMTEFADTDEP